MLRSILPFILASLGFVLVALVVNMPLLEWQISEITTDFPSEVHFNSSPWSAKFGDSLENGSYTNLDDSYISHQVYVSENRNNCIPEHLNAVVRRSRIDEVVDRTAGFINQNIIPWLSGRNTFGVLLFLCGTYIWWFASWYKRPIVEGLIFTAIAMILIGLLINVWRVFFSKIGVPWCMELRGTVTFSAQLSKVHYETLIVLLSAILAEVGALSMMLRQVIKAAIHTEETSRLIAG